MNKIIKVDNVYKKYKKYNRSKDRLLDVIIPGKFSEDFYALYDVTFDADEGEVIGFIGINGSGKSTLSNIIAGVVPETSGQIYVNGEVAIIAVAAGLKNDLTGRDNIELKLLMLGFSKQEIIDLEEEIIEFAELEEFIDQPVKSYSSGMKSRLGFSISVAVNPDVLIIDEALSVGDKAFAEKSLNKMNEFKSEGKTMIFVSHSLGQMRKFCDKILWLEYGRVKDYGNTEDVLPKYEEFLNLWKLMSSEERKEYRYNIINDNSDRNKRMIVKKTEELEEKVNEASISRLGKLKDIKHIHLYNHPTTKGTIEIPKDYYERTFYIKKRIDYKKERYYLISSQPSGIDGVHGWIKGKEIRTLPHLLIDEDQKSFIITGDGPAYKLPWGSDKDVVYHSLIEFKGELFTVHRSERVGKHMWYFGLLKDNYVWIRWNQVKRLK